MTSMSSSANSFVLYAAYNVPVKLRSVPTAAPPGAAIRSFQHTPFNLQLPSCDQSKSFRAPRSILVIYILLILGIVTLCHYNSVPRTFAPSPSSSSDDVDHKKPSPYSMTRHPLQGSCTATHGFHIATAQNDASAPDTGHGVMR